MPYNQNKTNYRTLFAEIKQISTNTNSYNLRNNRTWVLPKVRTVCYGLESVRYRGPKIWEMLPKDIKEANSLAAFKTKIKTWKAPDCPCRLCKTYVPNLGFIN